MALRGTFSNDRREDSILRLSTLLLQTALKCLMVVVTLIEALQGENVVEKYAVNGFNGEDIDNSLEENCKKSETKESFFV